MNKNFPEDTNFFSTEMHKELQMTRDLNNQLNSENIKNLD